MKLWAKKPQMRSNITYVAQELVTVTSVMGVVVIQLYQGAQIQHRELVQGWNQWTSHLDTCVICQLRESLLTYVLKGGRQTVGEWRSMERRRDDCDFQARQS